MSASILDAGSNLNHVRGLVCKAVRKNAPRAELKALLIAEEHAQEALHQAIEADLQASIEALGWTHYGTAGAARVLVRARSAAHA